MQDIILWLVGTGFQNVYVNIYNSYGNLVFSDKVIDEKVELCLEKDKVYCLEALVNNRKIIIPFYVTNYHYVFSFNDFTLNENATIFSLTDYYYDNLPVMKGVLYFGKDS